MTARRRKIKQTGRAAHERRVHVYGFSDTPPKTTTMLSIQLPGQGSTVAWLPRAEVRKVRDALSKILGDHDDRR